MQPVMATFDVYPLSSTIRYDVSSLSMHRIVSVPMQNIAFTPNAICLSHVLWHRPTRRRSPLQVTRQGHDGLRVGWRRALKCIRKRVSTIGGAGDGDLPCKSSEPSELPDSVHHLGTKVFLHILLSFGFYFYVLGSSFYRAHVQQMLARLGVRKPAFTTPRKSESIF